METPYQLVRKHYEFYDLFGNPMQDREYQIYTVNELAPLQKAGYWLDVGCGKTFSSTASALFKKIIGESDIVIVTMPPVLIPGWAAFLSKVRPKLNVVACVGTPKKRQAISFDGVDFVLMSQDIFKIDFDLILQKIGKRKPTLNIDEATCVKNISTSNYKAMDEFIGLTGGNLELLSGTPLNTPLDGYAYIKMLAPGTYRNLHQFENIHVAERDFFKKPVSFKNLDLLADNMKLNAVRLLRREVRQDAADVQFIPMLYDLEPAHYKLYKQLVDEELIELESGGKIDATGENALYNAAQQLVTNWGYFAQDPKLVSAGFKLIEEVLEELGDKKLIVFANFRITNRSLIEHFSKVLGCKVLAIYGDISRREQDWNKQAFIDDHKHRMMVAQCRSAGVGIDGWQHVCTDAFFLELPYTPKDFNQAVGRIDRDGQMETTNIRVACANNTIQAKLMRDVMRKDDIVNRVMPTIKTMRAALFGD